MRFCVPIPCFFGQTDFSQAIRTVGKLGFDAAETYNWKGLDPDSVRIACEESGVELLSICTTEFNMTNPEYRSLWLEGLKESISAAKKLGVKRLITQVGPDTGAPRPEQHESVIAALKAGRPMLEDAGITIMIEPLNTLINHKGTYLWSSSEAFDIIHEVGSPYVKVVFDIYHQQISEGNIIPNITQNLDCIAHLHCAGHPGRHELQFGENDYHVIFKAIDQSGYIGACGLEYLPTMDPSESLKRTKMLYS